MSLCVEHLCFGYRCWNVLDDVSFSADDGNLYCLLGCNGAGKSTLFRCILGMLPFKKGRILADGADIRSLSIKERARRIAYIPQSQSGVFNYSALDIVLMGTTSQLSSFSCPGKSQVEKALKAMEALGVARLAERSYAHLSGGERQLVLIARAIAQQATTLIMDEPCSSLDYGNQIYVMQQVKNLAKKGYLVLMSTHNPEQAFLFADQVLVLQDKRIECCGAPREVLSAPLIERIYGISVTLHDVDGIPVCIPERSFTKEERLKDNLSTDIER